MAKNILNINLDTQQKQSGFVEQLPNIILGPDITAKSSQNLATEAVQEPVVANVANWEVMSAFDEGLKAALLDFVDTTNENVKYPHNNFNGRKKTLDYFFSGTATRSLKAGEVGHFKITFLYPPQSTTPTLNINQASTSN